GCSLFLPGLIGSSSRERRQSRGRDRSTLKGRLQHRRAASIDPVKFALADLVRRSDGALSYPSLQRFQVGLENAIDRTDSPLFKLCAHIFNPRLLEEFKAKRSMGKLSLVVRPRVSLLVAV